MFGPPVASLGVTLHSLEEGDTRAERELNVVSFQVPCLVNVVHTKVDSGAFRIRMRVCINNIPVLDEETQLGGECDEKPETVLIHTSRICVLKSVHHAHKLFTIHALACLESSTSLLRIIPDRVDNGAGRGDGGSGQRFPVHPERVVLVEL
jgi:hypothetical protein